MFTLNINNIGPCVLLVSVSSGLPLANLSAFSIGTMLGWTSPMQPLLSSNNPPVGTEPVSIDLISWLGSINFIGAMIGTLFWGILSDRMGRKCTAMIVAIPFIISWTMILAAQNVWWLVVARVVVGVGCSGVIINTPIYVTEMAEDKIRGSLGSFLMIFLNAGCVFSYVIGSLTTYHTLASVCLCIPIVFLACMSFLPESPVYLWTKGKTSKAEKSLIWFRGGDTLKTIKEIEAFKNKSSTTTQSPSISNLISSKGVRKAIIISLSFILGQQFCGMLAILTYTVQIFQKSGSSLSAQNSMIIVGIMQLTSSLASSALVDRAGRRVLLISSYIATAVSLSVLSGYLYYQDDSWNPVLHWVPILCISIDVIFYSIGLGPVPYVVMAEIFPTNIRGFAISKIHLLSTFLSFVTVKTFPFLTSFLGSHGCFLFYGSCCAILSVFTFLLVPETKGKPLITILKKLNGEDEKVIDNTESLELVNTHKNRIVKA